MGFSLGNLFDPAGIFSGDKGDIVGNLLDPVGGTLANYGLDEYNPLGDTHEDVNAWMDDLADVNSVTAQDRWKKVRENPQRLLYSGGDLFTSYNPVGTRIANKWEGDSSVSPAWDMYGGKTPENYQNAEKRGFDTSNSMGFDAVGNTIGKGIINYFTFGLGSTALDALNDWGYGNESDAGDTLKKAAQNWAINYATQGAGDYLGGADGFNLGTSIGAGEYAPIVNQTAKGALGGALNTAVQGGNSSDIGKGALQGGVMQGVRSGANMAGNYLGNMFQSDPDDPFTDSNTGTLGNMRDQYGDVMPIQDQPSYTTEASLTGMNRMQPMSAMAQPQSQAASPVTDFISSYLPSGGRANMGNYADLAGNLFGIYNANKQRKRLQEQQSQLQNLFSPNSPYALQARQAMERKDAAAGRRSQYGPREAQLAALLTERQAATMPQQERYAQGIGGYENAIINNLLKGGSNIYNMYRTPYQGAFGPSGIPWRPTEE